MQLNYGIHKFKFDAPSLACVLVILRIKVHRARFSRVPQFVKSTIVRIAERNFENLVY